MPGHTCDPCMKLKTRYSKSTGQGGKLRKEVMVAPGPKEKEKEKEKVPGMCNTLYLRFWSEVH